MPEIYTYNRISLPNDRYAIDYALKDSDADIPDNSIIKIINKKDDKLINEIKVNGEIKTMCFIANKGFLAVVIEGSKQISIYNPNENKLVATLSVGGIVGVLSATPRFLIASANGSLYFFNVDTFDPHKTIKLGDVIGAMTTSDTFIVCDVWKQKESASQVTMYDSNGIFIRDLGEPRIKAKIRSCFMGMLDNENIFVAIPNESACNISVYQFETGKQLNLIEFKNNAQLFIYSLYRGGIAICQDNGSDKTVSVVYDSLAPDISLLGKTDLILRSREDMLLFISNKEREGIPSLIKSITSVLGQIGIFPKPLDQLITAYSIPSQALEEKEIEQLISKVSF